MTDIETEIDLKWANGWGVEPKLVIDCTILNHRNQGFVTDIDEGQPPYRGLHHVVRCSKCNYVYRYDSSD